LATEQRLSQKKKKEEGGDIMSVRQTGRAEKGRNLLGGKVSQRTFNDGNSPKKEKVLRGGLGPKKAVDRET